MQYDYMEKKAIEANKIWDNWISIQIGDNGDKEGVNLKNQNQIECHSKMYIGFMFINKYQKRRTKDPLDERERGEEKLA